MSGEVHEQSTRTETITAYASYSFDTDETYQQGLASILAGGTIAPTAPPEVKEEMIRRTRVFYFNQTTGNNITMEEARNQEVSTQDSESDTHSQTTPIPKSQDDERVLTFAELTELIESGKVDQIPNNKVIPDLLSDATPSKSTAGPRKKPWETLAGARK